jgi:diadenosine tetraphosphate (Ap4A) HIT family hydrolase
MTTLIHERVEMARAGTNPTVICRMASGWAVLCDAQYLRGYSILLPDPVVEDLSDLGLAERNQYLSDMAVVGEALKEVTGAYRINYAIFGNLEPALHAQICPRYLSEPDDLRRGPHFVYIQRGLNSVKFDYERDYDLMQAIATAIQNRK